MVTKTGIKVVGTVFVTKAESDTDARAKVHRFLKNNKHVYSAFRFGGSWTGSLNEASYKFAEKARVILKKHPDNTPEHINCGEVSIDSMEHYMQELQDLWENELGQMGDNPCVSTGPNGGIYDTWPLENCLDSVIAFRNKRDPAKALEEAFKSFKYINNQYDKESRLLNPKKRWRRWLRKLKGKDNTTQQKQHLSKVRNLRKALGDKQITLGTLLSERYHFECSFYNIDDMGYSLPKEPEGWWAVMVELIQKSGETISLSDIIRDLGIE